MDAGKFTDRDKKDDGKPGSYQYGGEAIDIIKAHGNTHKQKKIVVIIVKDLASGAAGTTFSDKIETKNGDQLGDKEGIMYDEDSLLDQPADGYGELTPAHEAAHLAGAPDQPNDQYGDWGKLNSYDRNRSDALSDEWEKKTGEYFDGKTEPYPGE